MRRHTAHVLPLFTRAEAREVDRDAVEHVGLPSLLLMENAGRGATDAIVECFPEQLGRVVLVGGPGQNGGDAWVVARRLALLGHEPSAVLVGEPGKLRGDAKQNWDVLATLGVETHVAPPGAGGVLSELLARATLVVDGLFGTGLDRDIVSGYAETVEALSRAEVPLVALDLPSGIDADTGAVLGVATTASLTVTFAGHKRGLHQHPGVDHAGRVVVADIGIAPRQRPGATLWDRADLAELIPPRDADAHKGTNGHLLVVGGSPGKTGAALLAGRAAFRAGAGLVTLGARSDTRAAFEEKVVEMMTTELPKKPNAKTVGALVDGKRAAVVGPGIGTDALAKGWVEAFAVHCPVPVVFDADGLTLLSETGLAALKKAAGPRVLTPHPGEAARLLGSTTAQVQADRYGAAAQLHKDSGQVVVLKGARTVIAGAGGELRVCREGNPALGVAGTGDVLCGLIGALSLTLGPTEAATAAVILHALAGGHAAKTDRGILAREVADAVPDVLSACSSCASC